MESSSKTAVSETNEQHALPCKSERPYGKRSRKILVLSVALFVFSLAVLILGALCPTFAEWYTTTVSAFFRAALALLTAPFPFSLAETLVLAGPAAFVILLLFRILQRVFTKKKGCVRRFLLHSFCFVLCALSVVMQTFGICYKRNRVETRFALDTDTLTEHDIYVSALLVKHMAEDSRQSLLCDADGATQMPYDFQTLKQIIRKGYAQLMPALPPVLSIKPVALSEPWTYMHISGMYMPLTGESNLNMNFPDYTLAFTACHETAHQLGIAYESEANFYAFLACLYAEDDYLRYAGCVNLLEYLMADLSAKDLQTLFQSMDAGIIGEWRAYSAFFEKYRASTAAKLSDSVNDGYLKSQGVASGTANYSEVSRLAAAYLKQHFPESYA